jgi:predicted nucleotidyltransferase
VDRKHERRDAPDISKIISEYADAGNKERLYTDELQLLEAAEFDITAAGARLLGRDACRIWTAENAISVANVLTDIRLRQELLNQMVQGGARSDKSFADLCALLLDNFERRFTERQHHEEDGR